MSLYLEFAAEVRDTHGNRCFLKGNSGVAGSEQSSRKLFLDQLHELGLSVVTIDITKIEPYDWSKREHVRNGCQTCTMCGRITERDETNTLRVDIPLRKRCYQKFSPLCDECYDVLYDRRLEIEKELSLDSSEE